MKHSTIIVAGGSGTRMGAAVPKQFLLLKGRPLLCWTIEAFRAFDAQMPIIVVLPEAQIATWKKLCSQHAFGVEHTVLAGGSERHHSVKNGLAELQRDGHVAVHDGVRPLVSKELIARCFKAAEEHGAAVPVIPISSSVREIEGGTSGSLATSKAVDRARFRAVQTPQCFRVDLLKSAFEMPFDPAFTDEATLVERTGAAVFLVEGEESNLKVTTQMDLRVAEVLIEARKP